MNPELSSRVLPILRLLLAGISIWLAAVNLSQIEFLWAMESDSTKQFFFTIHVLWILNSVFILGLGLFGPLGPVLNAIFMFFSCDNSIHGAGLDIWIYETISIFSIFLPLSARFSLDRYFSILHFKERIGAWPLVLLGINWGVIFFFGGLAKLADPLWLSGEAVYYFLSLPHITSPWASSIAEMGVPLFLLNYFVIAFEVFFLFLFILKKTRLIAVTLLVCFFAFLGFPMEMLFVGPMGVMLGLFLLVTTPQFNLFMKTSSSSVPIGWRLKSFIFLVLSFVLFNFAVQVVYNYQKLIYPSVGGHLKWQESNVGKIISKIDNRDAFFMKYLHVKNFFRFYHKYIQPINRSTFKVEYISPFNSYHIIGFFAYRVYACNVKCVEPVDVFKVDKHPGAYAGTGYTGWLFSLAYRMSAHAYLQKIGQFSDINSHNRQYYLSLFNFAAKKLGKKRSDFKYFQIDVVPINLADRRAGKPHPYLSQDYGKFLTYQPNEDKWELFSDYPDFHVKFDLRQFGQLFLSTRK